MINEGQIVCEACHDSGWQRFECTGDNACGRWRTHLPHTYARECSCRPMNPVWQEKQQRSMKRGRAAA